MSERVHDYEQVSVYGLDEAAREELLRTHAECTFNWSTADGWPVGVIMSYLWQDGRFWLTAGAHRHRIEAVRRDPRVSIVVTSTGTKLGAGKSITAKGRCVVHEDAETKRWFYPAFAHHLYPAPAAAEAFAKLPRLAAPHRARGRAGEMDHLRRREDVPRQRGQARAGSAAPQPKSSDTVRLARERERRGLA